MFPYFEYAGYSIIGGRRGDTLMMSLTYLFCLIPVLFFRGIRVISSFLSVFIYFILYVPTIIIFYFALETNRFHIVYLQVLFLSGMIMLFLADRIKFKRPIVLYSRINIFKIVYFLLIVFTLYMLWRYKGNLKLVSFQDVYTQRSETEDIGSDLITSYLSAWLANVLIPISLAYGLFSKKRVYFVTATISCVIIYMATASKSVLLFPLIIFLLFKLLKERRVKAAFSYIGMGLIGLMSFGLLSGFNIFSSLLWMRTIGNSGVLTKDYYMFFQSHPFTYYTHINVINFFTKSYPYGAKGLGQVIGPFYYGPLTNANANFWATDGIAAVGDFGILLSSVFLFIIFVIFNSISKNYSKVFLILILIPYLFSLLNASLFSSLLTGGAFFTFFILTFESSKKNIYINKKPSEN